MKSFQKNSRGMTLVLALFVIALLTLLILGLLLKSQSSHKGSYLHVEALRAQQMGESAMSLVLSRIQEATFPQTGQPGQAWASQPGAIRVYGGSGELVAIHKLYSSENAIATNAGDLQNDLPPADWRDQPNLFVDLNAPYSKGGAMSFPIVDPRLYSGTGTNDPEGFSYQKSTPPPDGRTIEGVVMPGEGEEKQRLPMPVKWIYVLSNGKFAAPAGQPDGTVRIDGAGNDGEIVGRIGFWTDDETSKVNVNTAAGGAFWDTPRTQSQYERKLADSQPVQNEFQRYPGHPATVDLRAVFPTLSLDQLYDLVPRIKGGGSNQGTVETSATTTPPPIILDSDRMYASPAESRYRPDRSAYFNSDFARRIERGDFLMTATSRAPELNLFGKPRVAIWPIPMVLANRSPLDKLIANCATIREGGTIPSPYYFQREKSDSATYDYEQIARNKTLLKYLRTATGKTVPGFGGNFETKYTGPVRDQILTEIFDYVRAATNLKDPRGIKYADPNSATILEKGEGQVTPIRISDWGTRGFGRFLTVSEAFFWFTWQGDSTQIAQPGSATNPHPVVGLPDPFVEPNSTQTQVQAIFALQFAGMAAGYSEYGPDIIVKIEHLDQFMLNGASMGFPASGTIKFSVTSQVPIGGIEDFRSLVRGRTFKRDGSEEAFPFYSNVLLIPKSGASQMTGSNQKVKVTLYAGSEAPENLIQTIELDVPQASIQAPTKPGSGKFQKWGTTDRGNDRFNRTWNNPAADHGSYMFGSDRTRSLVSATGDHRLTAAFGQVPSSFFIPHRGPNGDNVAAWTNTTNGYRNLNSLMTPLAYGGQSQYADQILTGKLDGSITSYESQTTRPNVPTHVTGKPSGAAAWDWDTGIAEKTDGAYINKPDEGSLGRGGARKAYYSGGEDAAAALDETMFMPNRQIPSPGMFGSLPTGINPTNAANSRAWQTLQFRPDPAGHPGNSAPRDHLLLDLFWMPVVEPYAISEPFSTAGKINMNSRLAPFTYITRETALYALLRNERVLAMKPVDGSVQKYKGYQNPPADERSRLNIDETLKGFRQRFDDNRIFVSPTEISGLYLVPEGQTQAGALAFWAGQTFTGDNVREKPYANILAKLTTKSNSYSVHVVAQALKKGSGGAAGAELFGQKADRVTAEWKGTFVVERFLDPSDPRLPDFASEDGLKPENWAAQKYNGDTYYQTRVLQVREWR